MAIKVISDFISFFIHWSYSIDIDDIPQLASQNWKIFRLSVDDAGTVCLVIRTKGAGQFLYK